MRFCPAQLDHLVAQLRHLWESLANFLPGSERWFWPGKCEKYRSSDHAFMSRVHRPNNQSSAALFTLCLSQNPFLLRPLSRLFTRWIETGTGAATPMGDSCRARRWKRPGYRQHHSPHHPAVNEPHTHRPRQTLQRYRQKYPHPANHYLSTRCCAEIAH